MCFLAFCLFCFVLAVFTVSFILHLPVPGRNRAAREDVAKFAICFLPLFCYCRAAAAAKLLLLPVCFAAVGKNPPYA